MTHSEDRPISRRMFGRLMGGSAAIAAGGVSADEKRGAVVIQEPPRERPQPGSVELKNGLILSGMCSRQSTLAPDATKIDQQLELRLIDQGARRLYVSNRSSKPHVVNPLDVPQATFEIRRKRLNRAPLIRGQRVIGPFNAEGIATGEIVQPGGRREPITVAITRLNELSVEVTSLTHDLVYEVPFDAIPRRQLFPGILEQVEGFNTEPYRRLEMFRMLIRGDRLPEAAALLQTVSRDFPQLAAEQSEYQQMIREALARQFTAELERRRDVGQHRVAANGARVHPVENLVPETVVRVTSMIQDYAGRRQRIEQSRGQLHGLVAELKDDTQRALASEVVAEIVARVDEDSIDRLSAFELVMTADAGNGRPPADECLAMALSGWTMGAESSIRDLKEALAICELSEMVADLFRTETDEQAERNRLVERAVALEGISTEQVAALIRHMPSPQPLIVKSAPDGECTQFRIDAGPGMAGAVGFVPPEYHETRHYPAVIAFSGNYTDPESYLTWWQDQAVRHGYIVIVPVWYDGTGNGIEQAAASSAPDTAVGYDASADKHLQFLALLRRLRAGLRIDDERLFVAGHGFGGEIAMDLATSHADQFAGVISICGLGRRHLQWTAWNALDVPWYVVVGDAQPDWFDRLGTLASRLFKRSEDRKRFADVLFVKHMNRGAESYFEEADDIFAWMSLHQRKRFPDEISADLMRSTDLDWYWLRLDSIPQQFVRLDEPTSPLETGFNPVPLKARLPGKNLIILERLPGTATLYLAPDLPGLRVEEPVIISVPGAARQKVSWDPSIRVMLERFHETADRGRLAWMKVTAAGRTGQR